MSTAELDRLVGRLFALLDVDPESDEALLVEIPLRLGYVHGPRRQVDDAARRLGLSRRALSRRLSAAGLPSLGKAMAWGRTLRGMARWSDDDVPTLRDVAADIGWWASGCELSQHVQRHAGVYPTEWSGDLDALCLLLVNEWRTEHTERRTA